MNVKHITIRKLTSSDWKIFRDMRLHALKTEPGVFSMSYEDEARLADQDWQGRLSSDIRVFFGLFSGDTLVGITGIIRENADLKSDRVVLVASYLLPEYRGRGLSHKFYEARLDWASEQPDIKTVIVSHRRSNKKSRRANQAFGFIQTGIAPAIWPDGSTEDEIFYALDLISYRRPGRTP